MFKRVLNASMRRSIQRDFIKAVKCDDTAAAHILLQSDYADVNWQKSVSSILSAARSDRSAIRFAIDNDSVEMMEVLVKHNVDINQNLVDGFYKMSPLYYAAEHAKTNCLKFLLDHPKTDLDAPLIMEDDAPFLEPLTISGLKNYLKSSNPPNESMKLIRNKLTQIEKAAMQSVATLKKLKR